MNPIPQTGTPLPMDKWREPGADFLADRIVGMLGWLVTRLSQAWGDDEGAEYSPSPPLKGVEDTLWAPACCKRYIVRCRRYGWQ